MSKEGNLRKGLASMPLDRRREIASMGGRAAHENGRAHRFTSEEARRAASMRKTFGRKKAP